LSYTTSSSRYPVSHLTHMNLRKRSTAFFSCLLSLSLLTVAGCNEDIGSSSRAGWITVGTKDKPRTLDSSDAYELKSLGIIANMGERLYTYNPGSNKLVPQLATELPKVSADGLTYTIPIRKGVLFHDGTSFDAEAMAFSLKRFILNSGKPSFLLSDRIDFLRKDKDLKTLNPDGLKATGKYELTIKLKQPFAAFPDLLAFPGACAISPKAYKMPILKQDPPPQKDDKPKDKATLKKEKAAKKVAKKAAAEKEKQEKFQPDMFVGTGPYKMLPKRSEDRIELEAFDKYWGAKPLNKGVVVQIYLGSASNLYNSFKTGAVDVAYLSLEPDQILDLQNSSKEKGWQVKEVDGNGTTYMMLNVKQKPLDKPAVRQALAALIDRPGMNQRVFYGQGKPLYSLIPDNFPQAQDGFKGAYSSVTGGSDIARAKKLLKEAGFSAQNPARVQIWYKSSTISDKMIANFLRAYNKKNMEGIMILEPNAAEATAFGKMLETGAYPVAFQTWYPDFIDVDTYIQPFLECPEPAKVELGVQGQGCKEGGSASQGSFYYDAAMNKMIAEQGKALNPAERSGILQKIQEKAVTDVPQIPLFQTKDFIFSRPGITGANTDPLQNLQYSSIKKSATK
jgi:peptide/nickel transport system substrate-binding protein